MEEWKDVVGYEGRYQVSNEGRVRSLRRIEDLNTMMRMKDKWMCRCRYENNDNTR